MSPDEIIKRLDRFEGILSDMHKEVNGMCVLVKIHDRQLPELTMLLARVQADLDQHKCRCADVVSKCPAEDIRAFRRWLWGTIGGVVAVLAATWAKIEALGK